MLKHIAALVFIFICAALAWVILGRTISYRTYNSDSGLRERVAALWGSPQAQRPPVAVASIGTIPLFVALESSRIDVDLDLEHRQKGLLWYSTYGVKFAGVYRF